MRAHQDGARRAEQGQHAIGLGRLVRVRAGVRVRVRARVSVRVNIRFRVGLGRLAGLVEYCEVKRGQRDDLRVGRRGARAQDNLLRVRGS